MQIAIYFFAAVISYLIGAVNPAIVLSKLIYHKDIRDLGSKNPGFTNFKRVFGGKYAFLVFALDIFKSVLVCLGFGYIFSRYGIEYQLGAAFAGLFAVIGHCFPIFYKFRGGKGFLVCISMIWCVDLRAGIVSTCVMIVFLFAFHYMSLASICAGVSCPITLLICKTGSLLAIILCLASVLLMVWRHKENIKRLISGTESKFYLFCSNRKNT